MMHSALDIGWSSVSSFQLSGSYCCEHPWMFLPVLEGGISGPQSRDLHLDLVNDASLLSKVVSHQRFPFQSLSLSYPSL